MKNKVENILGYSVTFGKPAACVNSIVSWINANRQSEIKRGRWLACINPHSYVEATKDISFSKALHNANWLVPDGAGFVLASKILRGRIQSRITGSDIYDGVMSELNLSNNFSVFFLGSTKETLEAIKNRSAIDYPNVRLAGVYSPPFQATYSQDELDIITGVINSASPDVLWVGMTAPKQEKWIYDNLNNLNISFAAAIGAVFDFYAGNVKRSHPIFQRNGLEWLPRLLQQPTRLWRRTFVSAPIFLLHVARDFFRSLK